MEAITVFAPKTRSHQLSLSSRNHLFPIRKFSCYPLTSFPRKPARALPTLSCDGQESNRKFEKFPPSQWTDRFHSVTVDASEMDMLRREIDMLKPEVKKTLMSSGQGIDSAKKRILMIYLLVSLGLAYHFEDEIEESLKEGFEKIEMMMAGEDDLYTISIIFWVLRTYGHHISSDVFKRFKEKNGKFKECLIGDAKGMLALYEAAHLGTTTDDILDEALSFTTNHLKLLAADKSCPSHLSKHIQNGLRLCQHRNMEILVVVGFIPFYEKEDDHDKTLLKLAKVNFNLMQLHYLEELKIVTKWYKDIDFASNLPPYFRYVIVENHFFVVGMYFQPKFSEKRILQTKCFTTLVLLDDTYDRYASLHECEILAKSLERWAPDVAMETQPDYLKFVFKFLADTFQVFETELTSEGRSYSVEAARKEFNIMVKANNDLAKWAQAGHVPSFEEYMEVGVLELGVFATFAGVLMGMGHMADEKVFEWLKSRPKLAQTIPMLGRLLNDITGFEHDMSRGYVTGSVNCFMKQHGVTENEATRELRKIVAYAYKVMNEEFLKESDVVPFQILNLLINIARTMFISYNEGEGFTFPEGAVNEYIASVFVNKIHL